MVANAVQKTINSLLKQQIANRYGKLAKSKNLSNLKQAMLDKADTVKLFDEYATEFPDIFTKDLQLAEDDLRKAHAAWYKNKTLEDKLKNLEKRGYVPEDIEKEPRKTKTQNKLLQLNDDVQDLLKKYEFNDERYLSQENPAYIDDMQRHIDNSSELSKAEKENLTKRLNTKHSFEKSGEYDKNTETFEKRSKDINRLTTQFLKSIENNTKREKPDVNFHKFYELLKEKTSDKSTIDKALDAFREQTQTKQSSLLDTLKEAASDGDFPVKSVLKDIRGQDFQDLLKKLNVRNYKGLRGARSLFGILKAKNRTPTQELFISKYNDLISKPAHNPANKKADYDMLRWRNQHRPEIVDAFEDEYGNMTYSPKQNVMGEQSNEYIDNLDDFANEKGYTKKQRSNKTTIEYDEPYEGRSKPVITNEQHGFTPKYTNKDIENYLNILKNPVRSEKQTNILQKLRDILEYNEYPLSTQQIEQIKRSDLLEQIYSNLWNLWRDKKFIDIE